LRHGQCDRVERHFGWPKINADLQDVDHQVDEEFGDRLGVREVEKCLGSVAARFNDARAVSSSL